MVPETEEGNRPTRESLKTHRTDWKDKLRKNCLRRITEERAHLLWKIRSNERRQSTDKKEIVESAFRDIVSAELQKIKQSPFCDCQEISVSKNDDLLWEYDGLHSDNSIEIESEDILIEMERLLYEELREEMVRRGNFRELVVHEEEDEFLARAVFEHMQLDNNQYGHTMGTQEVWDGTLSSEDFYIAAKALCDKWREMNSSFPQWMWIRSKREEGYLSLENVHYLCSNEEPAGEQDFPEEEEPVDSATLVHRPNEETHIYNFHIVYSFSYRVPVLYFRGHRCDGQPLNSDDIQKDLPSYSQSLLKESKWTFMTQEEHPFLHSPWYTLHPCGTSDWMKLLLGDIQHKDLMVVQFLPSWLSVVAQPVGLRVPLNMHAKAV